MGAQQYTRSSISEKHMKGSLGNGFGARQAARHVVPMERGRVCSAHVLQKMGGTAKK